MLVMQQKPALVREGSNNQTAGNNFEDDEVNFLVSLFANDNSLELHETQMCTSRSDPGAVQLHSFPRSHSMPVDYTDMTETALFPSANESSSSRDQLHFQHQTFGALSERKHSTASAPDSLYYPPAIASPFLKRKSDSMMKPGRRQFGDAPATGSRPSPKKRRSQMSTDSIYEESEESDDCSSAATGASTSTTKKIKVPWNQTEERIILNIVYHFVDKDLKSISQIVQNCGVNRSNRAIDKKLKRLLQFDKWNSRVQSEIQTSIGQLVSSDPGLQLSTKEAEQLEHVKAQYGAACYEPLMTRSKHNF